jgi:uncharacterized membrane protein YdjX (TVP38/TMEM64 family)
VTWQWYVAIGSTITFTTGWLAARAGFDDDAERV